MKGVPSSLAALGMLASIAVATTAQAADRYGVVCIHNRTGVSINFQAKVGNGQWQQFTLAPGANRWFSHKYSFGGQDSSPPLEVKFDSDLRRNSLFNLTYQLKRSAAEGDSCAEGKPYGFQYEPNNRSFIDLKAL